MKKYTIKIKKVLNPPFTKVEIIQLNDLMELNKVDGLKDFEILEKNCDKKDGDNSVPIELAWSFAMFMKDWRQHGSGYFYKSKDEHQWPPDQTATKEDLIKMFFIETKGQN